MHRRRFFSRCATAVVLLVMPKAAFASGMQIFVKTLTGRTVTREVDSADTIETVKQKLAAKASLKLDGLRLSFGDKPLDEKRTLADYKITKEATLQLVRAGKAR